MTDKIAKAKTGQDESDAVQLDQNNLWLKENLRLDDAY